MTQKSHYVNCNHEKRKGAFSIAIRKLRFGHDYVRFFLEHDVSEEYFMNAMS